MKLPEQGDGAVDQKQGHDSVGGSGVPGKQQFKHGAKSAPCDGKNESQECQQHGKKTAFISIVGDDDPGKTIIRDLEKENVINPDDFFSKGKATPFDGMKVKGECVLTVCNGKVAYTK